MIEKTKPKETDYKSKGPSVCVPSRSIVAGMCLGPHRGAGPPRQIRTGAARPVNQSRRRPARRELSREEKGGALTSSLSKIHHLDFEGSVKYC